MEDVIIGSSSKVGTSSWCRLHRVFLKTDKGTVPVSVGDIWSLDLDSRTVALQQHKKHCLVIMDVSMNGLSLVLTGCLVKAMVPSFLELKEGSYAKITRWTNIVLTDAECSPHILSTKVGSIVDNLSPSLSAEGLNNAEKTFYALCIYFDIHRPW